jgi:hypothetical protein
MVNPCSRTREGCSRCFGLTPMLNCPKNRTPFYLVTVQQQLRFMPQKSTDPTKFRAKRGKPRSRIQGRIPSYSWVRADNCPSRVDPESSLNSASSILRRSGFRTVTNTCHPHSDVLRARTTSSSVKCVGVRPDGKRGNN